LFLHFVRQIWFLHLTVPTIEPGFACSLSRNATIRTRTCPVVVCYTSGSFHVSKIMLLAPSSLFCYSRFAPILFLFHISLTWLLFNWTLSKFMQIQLVRKANIILPLSRNIRCTQPITTYIGCNNILY
jgi:hypothetical protein